jgi:O-antigen/teichoic acid export membrane protein
MSEEVEKEVQYGAFVNALGLAGKMAGPTFLVLVIRLYGPDVYGVYATAYALVEMALAFLSSGFKDASMMYVSRYADQEDGTDALYRSLTNALAWSLAAAALVIGGTFTLGVWLIPEVYEYGDRLLFMVQWMVLALPFMAFERVVIAATQGLKIMKYESFINGGARPVLLLVIAAGAWFVAPTVGGLTLTYVLTQGIIAAIAIYVYQRELEWRALFRAFRNFEFQREMLSFALPQNLNQALERFLTNVDVVMLGMFGISARLTGFYSAGALVVRELRHIKLVFSSAYAPHIPRLYQSDDRKELGRTLATTSRWIASLIIPALLGLAVLRTDILQLIEPSFGGREALFMLFLLPIPYLQGSFGLAGNSVVMTGNSHLNLLNSVVTGTTNVLLNVWLIPLFGIVGAAAASSTSNVIKAVMEVGEMKVLLNIPIMTRLLYPPHVAGGICALGLTAVMSGTNWMGMGLWIRGAIAASGVVAFVGVLSLVQGHVPRMPALLREKETPGGIDAAETEREPSSEL